MESFLDVDLLRHLGAAHLGGAALIKQLIGWRLLDAVRHSCNSHYLIMVILFLPTVWVNSPFRSIEMFFDLA